MLKIDCLCHEERSFTATLSFSQQFLSGIKHDISFINGAFVKLLDGCEVSRMVHQVCIILVGHLIDHQSFIKLADHVGGGRDCYPKNWPRQTTPTREPADLHRQQLAIDRACCTCAKERNHRRRNNSDTFRSRTRETSIRSQLPRNAWQQVFVRKVRQAHRNRVYKEHTIAAFGEAPHQMVFRVWMVIPPILPAKTNNRLSLNHVGSV